MDRRIIYAHADATISRNKNRDKNRKNGLFAYFHNASSRAESSSFMNDNLVIMLRRKNLRFFSPLCLPIEQTLVQTTVRARILLKASFFVSWARLRFRRWMDHDVYVNRIVAEAGLRWSPDRPISFWREALQYICRIVHQPESTIPCAITVGLNDEGEVEWTQIDVCCACKNQ